MNVAQHEEPPVARSGKPARLDVATIDPPLRAAFEEDLGSGDVTTVNTVPAGTRAAGRLIAREAGRLAGLDVFTRAFELRDPDVRIERLIEDGEELTAGAVVATLEGDARALLEAERTALNFVQRMSGIATLTARFVARAACAASGGGAPGRRSARILDTRKTGPGLRALEKYAVRCGGGENHRFGLFDEVMIKDNHLDLAAKPLDELVAATRRAVGPRMRITAEARDEREAFAAVRGGADVVLLDNFRAPELRELCPRLSAAAAAAGRTIEFEASGGIDESNVAELAATGVDRLSIGALTHSARALDLSLSLEPLA